MAAQKYKQNMQQPSTQGQGFLAVQIYEKDSKIIRTSCHIFMKLTPWFLLAFLRLA